MCSLFCFVQTCVLHLRRFGQHFMFRFVCFWFEPKVNGKVYWIEYHFSIFSIQIFTSIIHFVFFFISRSHEKKWFTLLCLDEFIMNLWIICLIGIELTEILKWFMNLREKILRAHSKWKFHPKNFTFWMPMIINLRK